VKFIENEKIRLKLIFNILFLVVAVLNFTRGAQPVKKISPFDQFLIEIFAPIQKGYTSIHRSLNSLFKNYLFNINSSKENQILKKKTAQLENTIFKFEELAKENTRLRELLLLARELPQTSVLAQVVARDANSSFKAIRINKGLAHNIKLQSTVVTAQGVVGYVYRLTDQFSDVLTILDLNNKVDGIVERIRAHGILEGHEEGKMVMKYVAKTEPIILNDLILTSGLGNIYPKGIKIGNVTKIERENYGVTQNIQVTPLVDFNRLEEVLVLVGENDETKKREWEVLDGNLTPGVGLTK
jgi:rod shape-determining protein MreC